MDSLNFNIVNFDAQVIRSEVYNGGKSTLETERYAWVDFVFFCQEMKNELGADEIMIEPSRGEKDFWIARFFDENGQVAMIQFLLVLTPMGVDNTSALTKAINADYE